VRENLIGLPLHHLSPTRRLYCIRFVCNKEIWCKLTGHDSVKTAVNLQMYCSLYDCFSYPHPFCGTENCVAALILLSQCNLYYYEASLIITTRDIISCLTWIRKISPHRTMSVSYPSTEKFGSAVKNFDSHSEVSHLRPSPRTDIHRRNRSSSLLCTYNYSVRIT
jgi:hypothetical protein